MAQTFFLCAFSAWSLGGRADGVIPWIGALGWCSLLALYLDPRWWYELRRHPPGLMVLWAVVLAVITVGILNAQSVRVDLMDGSYRFEEYQYLPFLPAAIEKRRAFEYGLLLSGAMVQSVMLWTFLRRRTAIIRLAELLGLNGFVLAVTGAVFRLAGADKILGLAEPVADYFFASFRYHNHWTAYGLLSMGLCLGLGLHWHLRSYSDPHARRNRPDLFWFSALFLISVTLPMSTARAGVLINALFWGIVLLRLVLALLGGSDHPALVRLRSRKWRWVLTGGIGIMVLGLTVMSIWVARYDMVREWEKTIRQVDQARDGAPLDAHRFSHAWRDTGKMIAASPVAGWGMGSHLYLYNFFAGPEYRDAEGAMLVKKEFAHNDWLQFAAELGIPTFLCLIGLPAILMRRLWRRCSPPAFTQWILTGTGLVLILACFEFPLSNPAVLVLFFVSTTLGLRYWKLIMIRAE